MFNGILAGNTVVLVSEGGKPVQDTDRPDDMPGYRLVSGFTDAGSAILRTWRYEPLEGSASDAAVKLAQLQAQKLSDADALKVPALFPQWSAGSVAYKQGDRVLYQGTLYKVVQSHTSQADWSPDKAPSLFAKVLPGQDGTQAGAWVQPDSTNPYKKGDRVTHNGHTWESLVDGNVWEPGAQGVRQWKQI